MKRYFSEQMDRAIQQRLVIKKRINVPGTLRREYQATYYSAWYYIAVHMLLGIERFQTKEAIARQLGLTSGKVAEVIDFLVAAGLAEQFQPGRYKIGPTHLHLERESPLIAKHHTNWRMHAIRSLERPFDADVHYSVVAGVSDADLLKVKTMAVEFIKEVMAVIHASKDEGVHCFNLDIFPA